MIRRTKEEKIEVVKKVLQGLPITKVSKQTGIAFTTISYWLSDEDINPDKKYAKEHQDYAYRRNHGKLKKRKIQIPRELYPEGIEMASTLNPEELKKENKDLRKKIAYLEDKVAYLEALYKVIKEDASEVSKKKDLKR